MSEYHARKNGVSPYLIGAGLGALEIFSFLTAKRGLGVTTPFESTAALVERRLMPQLTHINEYIKGSDNTPKIGWETFLVLGIAAGGFLTSKARRRPTSAVYSSVWTKRFGESSATRNGIALVGGALMMFGARMAKGCTSGHGLTGNMQLALSSWVFTPLMFGISSLTARLLYIKGVQQ